MARKISNTSKANGTSFHGIEFTATVDQIVSILGEPSIEENTGEDKVNFEWICETESGKVFTIYDWKEYRRIDRDEPIDWHIGAHGSFGSESGESTSRTAKEEILSLLKSHA